MYHEVLQSHLLIKHYALKEKIVLICNLSNHVSSNY